MSCGHCRQSVEAALGALPGVAAVQVDLAARAVTVAGDAPPAALVAALQAIGFPAGVTG
jgi:copper chaperone CopZ